MQKKRTSDDWVNKNSVSNTFRTPEDFLDHMLDIPAFCMNIILAYLDEQWEKNGCREGRHDYEVWNDVYKCKKCNVISSFG